MRTAEQLRNQLPRKLPIDRKVPGKLETATFSMGCFWGPEALFGSVPGVYRTRVGYTGGVKENPSYRSLGTHTETVQIDYDPSEISFEQLLEIFWDNHNYSRRRKPQYASRIFYHNERQKQLAEETKSERERKDRVATAIKPLETFWVAEDYHQKYYLRIHNDIVEEFEQIYTPEEFINSTTAARLNAVAGGRLDRSDIDSEELGLDQASIQEL